MYYVVLLYFSVGLLRKCEGSAGLIVSLKYIYVCCRTKFTNLSYVDYTRLSCVVGAAAKLGHSFDCGMQSVCTSC